MTPPRAVPAPDRGTPTPPPREELPSEEPRCRPPGLPGAGRSLPTAPPTTGLPALRLPTAPTTTGLPALLRALVPGLLSLLLLAAAPCRGQEPTVHERLAPEVGRELVGFLNDSSTIRVSGRTRIPSSRTLVGDIGVLGGPFSVAGRIDGRLVVVNGDLELEPGAEVTGEVVVVGGVVSGAGDAVLGGGLTVYEEALRYRQRDGRVVYVGSRERERREDRPLRHDLGFGHSRITVRSGASYNRIEGLPVIFGPIVEFEGRNRLRLEALAIWRTESGLDLRPDELGYDVRVEQLLAGPALRVGLGTRSVVSPVEEWGVSDLESSLATFLFHEDFRDYVQKEGWSAYLRFAPRGAPLEVSLTYREEDHTILRPGGPWTLVDNDQPWRPQPAAAEGTLRSLIGGLTVDTRNREDDPSTGWLLDAEVEAGLGGTLRERAWRVAPDADYPGGEPPDAVRPSTASDTYFTRGLVDLRRYNRMGPGARLDLRVVVGGSLTGEPLPPQFQHAFGGVGSLPGYRLFSGDCGARTFPVELAGHPELGHFLPQYGCDRFAVFQAEYRGDFGFDFEIGGGDDDEWEWEYPTIDLTPSWAFFFDAGRGWARHRAVPGDVPAVLEGVGTPRDTREFYDAGFGLFAGDLGVYWALPLNGGDGVNFFVRLRHRF